MARPFRSGNGRAQPGSPVGGQVKPHGKQSCDDFVDLNFQRLRVNEKLQFHIRLGKKRRRVTETVRGAERECARRGGCTTGACSSTLRLHQYSSSGVAAGAGFSSFGASATVASVVRISPAIDAAF